MKLGLDYASSKELNPRLIFAHSSCYGPEGPDAGKRGDDPTAQGRIGMMTSCSDPMDRPHFVAPGSGDAIASMMLASAVQGALYAREKYGIAQQVTVSQVSVLMALLRFQARLLHGIQQSWSAEIITSAGAPLLDPDPVEFLRAMSQRYGIDPAAVIYDGDGWKRPATGQ